MPVSERVLRLIKFEWVPVAGYRLNEDIRSYSLLFNRKLNSMGDYIYPCKNKGRCRQIALKESMGIYVPINSGVRRIEKFSKNDLPVILNYTCCNMCYLPVDFHEAVKLNQFLGNKLPDIPVDEDFMKVLDGI